MHAEKLAKELLDNWEAGTLSEALAIVVIQQAIDDAEKRGTIAGMRRFAWWSDGVEHVGTSGTTLKQAIQDFKQEGGT